MILNSLLPCLCLPRIRIKTAHDQEHWLGLRNCPGGTIAKGIKNVKLGIVAHNFNPNIWETEIGRSA